MKFCSKNLHRLLVVAGFAGLFLALTERAGAQHTPPSNAGRITKWTMLAGTDSEIFFAIPQDSVVHENGDFYMGSNRVRVDSQKTIVSRLGDAVVQIDLFKGAAKQIQERLIDNFRDPDNRPAKVADTDKNGFRVAAIESRSEGLYFRRHFFRKLDRLYVMTGATRNPESSIVKEFFESVMLVKDGLVMTPNLSDKLEDASKVKMLLPKAFVERGSNAPVAAVIVDESSLEKKAVIVFQPNLQFPPIDSRFDRTFNLLKVKVLLLANGTVGEVEAVTKTTPAIERQAIDAAKGIKFLPAEKDGKPASVYRTIQFSLSIG
ncbi:MAG: energy transducer TonB [Pyrinomonadaceae bacterium]